MVTTIKELSDVLMERMDMKEEDAIKTALEVLDRFGFNSYIIDNVLETAAHEGGERDVFYWLEEKGILGTLQEEVTLYDGRSWRIFYWFIRADWKEHKPKVESDMAVQAEEDPAKKTYDIFWSTQPIEA